MSICLDSAGNRDRPLQSSANRSLHITCLLSDSGSWLVRTLLDCMFIKSFRYPIMTYSLLPRLLCWLHVAAEPDHVCAFQLDATV